MRRVVLLLPMLVWLAGCSSLQEDSVLKRPAQWLGRTGEVLRNWGGAEREGAYDEEVQRLFAQPYIDPLTRYLEQYRSDDSRAGHLQRVLKERNQRCSQIAQRFAERPATPQVLEQYRAGYAFSCPKQVEQFAQRVERVATGNEKVAKTITRAEEGTGPAASAPASQSSAASRSGSAAQPVWSGQLAQQLNDCYLLTTIRNYSEARTACLAPAEQGDLRAQYNMALIARSLEEYLDAVHWSHLAAPKSAEARHLLGQLYAAGQGVERDQSQALHWFSEAAELGLAAAQYQTGRFLQQGWGAGADLAAARSWYQRAAAQGNADAQLALGLMLLNGEGGAKNPGLGRHWLLRAARQGQSLAQYQLGHITEQGATSASTRAQALIWYQLAGQNGLDAGEEQAQRLRSSLTPAEIEAAQLLVRQALEGGR